MKILLAMGAMAAVVLASGCGGDAKSGESAAKAGSGIPKVIRVAQKPRSRHLNLPRMINM